MVISTLHTIEKSPIMGVYFKEHTISGYRVFPFLFCNEILLCYLIRRSTSDLLFN
jgi:hypothetical protein